MWELPLEPDLAVEWRRWVISRPSSMNCRDHASLGHEGVQGAWRLTLCRCARLRGASHPHPQRSSILAGNGIHHATPKLPITSIATFALGPSQFMYSTSLSSVVACTWRAPGWAQPELALRGVWRLDFRIEPFCKRRRRRVRSCASQLCSKGG